MWVTPCIFKQSSDYSSQSSSDCINFIKFGTVEEDFTSWLWKAQTLYIIASVYVSGRSKFEIVQPQRCHQNLGLFNLINSDCKKGKIRDCSAVFLPQASPQWTVVENSDNCCWFLGLFTKNLQKNWLVWRLQNSDCMVWQCLQHLNFYCCKCLVSCS